MECGIKPEQYVAFFVERHQRLPRLRQEAGGLTWKRMFICIIAIGQRPKGDLWKMSTAFGMPKRVRRIFMMVTQAVAVANHGKIFLIALTVARSWGGRDEG